MKSKSIIKNVFALVLTTALSVNGVSVIFAEEKAEEESSKKVIHQRINHEDISAIYQSALYNLVENGSITQEQADAIASSISERGEEHKSHFAGLMSAGTITQAQADAINEAMKDTGQSNQSLSEIATNLISAGTITQEQADAINSAMTSAEAKGERGKMPNHNEKSETFERKGPFEGLVSSGTITQEQANAINDAMKESGEAKQSLSDIATNLVSKGVITQEQADAVNSAMPLMKEKGAKGEMPKGSENGETFERKGPFEGLVSSGTITQAQADMVLNAVKTALEAANTDLK
ncbi:MAG TPA: hypothetical protein DCM73_14230 [Clostridiales bacterium]|nr:hypothetical protein [Clostridiales bacterium]